MKRAFDRELADILTCAPNDVEAGYDRVLECFRRRAGAGVMTFFRSVEIDGEPHYDKMRSAGDSDAVEVLENLDGDRLLEGPTLDLAAPGRNEVNAFVHHDADIPAFRGSSVYEELLKPLDIHSASRIMVYGGGEFTGWLGCFRRGDQPRADEDFRRRLEPMTKPVCAALSALDGLHRRRLSDIEGAAIFTPSGKLDFASPVIAEFLDDEKRRRMAKIVRDVDGGDVEECVQLVGGVEVRVTRLKGGGTFRYLAQFVAPEVPVLDPMAELTPAQREVAEYAAAGATNAEIGEATGRSPQTVKVHMRNIYDRLGIGSRVELVRKLQD